MDPLMDPLDPVDHLLPPDPSHPQLGPLLSPTVVALSPTKLPPPATRARNSAFPPTPPTASVKRSPYAAPPRELPPRRREEDPHFHCPPNCLFSPREASGRNREFLYKFKTHCVPPGKCIISMLYCNILLIILCGIIRIKVNIQNIHGLCYYKINRKLI